MVFAVQLMPDTYVVVHISGFAPLECLLHVRHGITHLRSPVSPVTAHHIILEKRYFGACFCFFRGQITRLFAQQHRLQLDGCIDIDIDRAGHNPWETFGHNIDSVTSHQLDPGLAQVPGKALTVLLGADQKAGSGRIVVENLHALINESGEV